MSRDAERRAKIRLSNRNLGRPVKLIAEKLGKTDKYDRLRFVRSDGSQSKISMPRQGTLPHDLVHYVVESALPLKHGFLSLVAAGADALFVMDTVHDRESPAIEADAVQAEAVVEALQTQLWTDTFEMDDFLEGRDSLRRARQGAVRFCRHRSARQPI